MSEDLREACEDWLVKDVGLRGNLAELVDFVHSREKVAAREAFQRGRESREPELAALRFELRHALEFLEDLEHSNNSCLNPTNPQAASFHLVHGGLFRALIAKADG